MQEITTEIGESVPPNTKHAVSVSLPTWAATVGYEESDPAVVSKMVTGYPRFFIHNSIKQLAAILSDEYARADEICYIFPTITVARRVREFVLDRAAKEGISGTPNVRILRLSTHQSEDVDVMISAVFIQSAYSHLAKQYWQHAGENISSRMAEYFMAHYKAGNDICQEEQFIEERFGRNLDFESAQDCKVLVRKRISGKVVDADHVGSHDDVYLYPTGMAAIFNAHQALLKLDCAKTGNISKKKSICFGFPYTDTLSILKKWGAGVHFYGFGDDNSLEELHDRLGTGEPILSLFCECPSNPLLKTPNLKRLRQLANDYGFAIVIDETVGNFMNIDVMPYADIVVSSLTKVFSGDSNVMAGSLVLNPKSRYYSELKSYMNMYYEDNLWLEDAIYLERNSRDFPQRSRVVCYNTERVVEYLAKQDIIKEVYYPSMVPSRKYYDAIKQPNGGYGGLFSLVFQHEKQAIAFFDSLYLCKGPSLGTNFTLACPYAILAHYNELNEIAKWGVDKNLVRVSVGLEDTNYLLQIFANAIEAACKAQI